ncbi:K Homology domain, type 1 [Dillenia turbinata]|uniref:K Homology domain, type 1 n=1 Tax=Dillenia turbinata TaxID=194707 RepID=A0AAN8V5Q5_9MAGN
MEGNRRPSFKRRSSSHFMKKGGGGYKKPKYQNFDHEQSSGDANNSDTVYRILCPSRKIGGVIGKGGSIVKSLREETQAKITVADSVPGSDERVIIIYSPPNKVPKNHDIDGDSAADEAEKMEPHCAAQDALLKVHDRIVEEDLFGGIKFEDDNESMIVTARLLVPNNMVGCVLGKKGDVIQRLRSETGANIRVLPPDHLPSCAMSTDELVQISGNSEVAKRALYEISTLLHQNPRKDKPPLGQPMPYGMQGFNSPNAPVGNRLPPGNPMWSNRNPASRNMEPMPWMGGFGNQPSGFRPGGFAGAPGGHGGEASGEFYMKILCSAAKIGGVIGKGGLNVKQLQQETGTNIHVEEASTESDERVIRVSAFEVMWNSRSQTIEAILQLQNKASEFSETGGITTRLLVPSSKVGCLLGQGGQVINEMRRRTQADIRIYSKDDKPKCASEDDELVQISGNYGVAKDALGEIASRLRARFLRDANAGGEHAPVGPMHGRAEHAPVGPIHGRAEHAPVGPMHGRAEYDPVGTMHGRAEYDPVGPMHGRAEYDPVGPMHGRAEYAPLGPMRGPGAAGHLPGKGPPPSGPMGAGTSVGFELPKGHGRDYELQGYPAPPTASRYPSMTTSMEQKLGNNAISSFGTGGSGISNISEMPGLRLKPQDSLTGGSDVEIRGSSENLNAGQNILQAYMPSGQSNNSPQGPYQNMNAQQGPSYQQSPQGPYQTMSAQQSSYQQYNPPQGHYLNAPPQQSPYQNVNAQQGSYQKITAQPGSYQY